MDDKIILITGGTGSLGRKLIKRIFAEFNPKKVIVYSRDEFKQSEMAKEYTYDKLRFQIGDVRDLPRLKRSMSKVDYVIHTAALKQVPTLEYCPTEAIKTNVIGAMNVIEACLDSHVERAVNISTDKAVNPVNLYGATKLVAEKLFTAANTYARTRFSSVRYGNVIGSRGSVVPLFLKLKKEGKNEFPVTDLEMTRFWITLDQAVDLVFYALNYNGKETIVPYIPSMSIKEVAEAICSDVICYPIGQRKGEKLHEVLIAKDETDVLLLKDGKLTECNEFRSDTSDFQMTRKELWKSLRD